MARAAAKGEGMAAARARAMANPNGASAIHLVIQDRSPLSTRR